MLPEGVDDGPSNCVPVAYVGDLDEFLAPGIDLKQSWLLYLGSELEGGRVLFVAVFQMNKYI